MSAPAPIDVVVVSYNTRELLRECLRSHLDAAAAGLITLTVVDNGSSDGSAATVADEFAEAVRLIETDNIGYGAAVNLGAAEGAGEWLVAANADVAVEPGALGRLLAAARNDPALGAIAPRLILPDGSTQHSVHCIPGVLLTLALGLGLTNLSPRLGDRLCIEGHWNPDRRRRIEWAHGAYLMIRRAAFESAGGFEPAQWMYAEDIEIAWRLRQAGFAVGYEPSARVGHAVSAATLAAFGEDRHQRHITATYQWLAARRGVFYPTAFLASNLLAIALRLAIYTLRRDQRRSLMQRYAAIQLRAWRRARAAPLRPAVTS